MKLASRFLSAVLFPSLVIAPAIAAGPFTVVADGLQNPRGLAFGPGGRLYVAQAGSGGATATGKITEIRYPWLANPAVHDVVTGLISVGKESTAVSVAGLSAIGNGNLYAAMEVSNAATGFPSRLGHLLRVSQGGQIRDVSNVGDFDYAWSNANLYRSRPGRRSLYRDPSAGGQHCLRPVSDCLSTTTSRRVIFRIRTRTGCWRCRTSCMSPMRRPTCLTWCIRTGQRRSLLTSPTTRSPMQRQPVSLKARTALSISGPWRWWTASSSARQPLSIASIQDRKST